MSHSQGLEKNNFLSKEPHEDSAGPGPEGQVLNLLNLQKCKTKGYTWCILNSSWNATCRETRVHKGKMRAVIFSRWGRGRFVDRTLFEADILGSLSGFSLQSCLSIWCLKPVFSEVNNLASHNFPSCYTHAMPCSHTDGCRRNWSELDIKYPQTLWWKQVGEKMPCEFLVVLSVSTVPLLL